MIYTNCTVTVSSGNSKIDAPIIIYRGDRELEIKFTIKESPYKFRNVNGQNLIEKTNADYAQLIIKGSNRTIFSDVTATEEGVVIFTITAEMVDEIDEIGFYTFQIRLYDETQESRITLPPVIDGISVLEPIIAEDTIEK